MYIYKTPSFVKKLFPRLLWDKADTERNVYLTFDDGPVPQISHFVMDTLEAFDAKATFFCVGDNIRKYPDIFQEMIVRGHQVGNHTYHHLNGWANSPRRYLKDVVACQKVMDSYYRHPPGSKALFRPPYGRIRKAQYESLLPHYEVVMWDVLSHDYDASQPETLCLQKCIQYTQPGSIVVFHDSLKAAKNLQYVLPRYLEHLQKLDYKCEALHPLALC